MIIIWGSKGRQECLGAAADVCEICQAVRPFWVTNYYRVGHIYYIPLGKGSLVASTRRCWSCDSEFHCDPGNYDDFLPRNAVELLTMDEVLRRTNGRLLRYLNSRQPPSLEGQRQIAHRADEEILDVLPVDDPGTKQ